MNKYKINKQFGGYSQTVEAMYFQQGDDYFVFYDESETAVLAVASKHVQTIDKVD